MFVHTVKLSVKILKNTFIINFINFKIQKTVKT